MPNYTDATRIAELKRIAEIYKPDGTICYFANEDLRLLLGRIAELEGQLAAKETEDEANEFRTIAAAALIYRSPVSDTQEYQDAQAAFKKAYDDVVKIMKLESVDARGGEKPNGQINP